MTRTATREVHRATNTLEYYLGRFRRRYKMRIVTTAIAAILFSILLVSIVTLLLKNTLADSNWLYFPARAMLFILPVIITIALLYRPYRDFKRSEGVDELESAVPEFNGRVDTYLDMKRRNSNSPFLDLLAKDASRTAARAPVKKILPGSEVMGPVVASFGMLALAAWLFTAMPLDWRASVKQLWMGWFISDILPERSIAIAPGDAKIRLGDSLTVTATIEGFESNIAQLHVQRIDSGNQSQNTNTTGSTTSTASSSMEWEAVNMNQSADGTFDFTLYGLSEPINYYVSSAFTESERARVDVVIPPKVTSISHTYNYPEWTGLEPKVIDDASEISAIAGTEVEVTFVTDKPLQNATISHGENSIAAESAGENIYIAKIVIEVPGEYQLLEILDKSKIPLSKAFDINIVEDAQPTIAFTHPGGDWSATSIEEVAVKVEAQDDYKVASVTMNFSVNGGDWQQVELSDENSFEHLFMLEEFTSDNDEPLIAGDLISYYAEAKDHEQQASTDIMFIDVRPFDRRYTQSQQAGGGGGGGGQQQQGQEISQRQKEILVSTFNLIRDSKQKQNQTKFQPIDPADTAVLLSELQTTLADQAIKLAERAEARQLLNNDPDIARFVEYMEEASSSMRPSSDALESMNLDDAVTHQQRALQYLKRAESIFNDISVNQSQGNGSGASASRDMAEIYELEMDLAKNQYERPDTGSQADQQQQSADDAFDKLKELAKRQERLAEAAKRNEKLSEAERWQQEKLKRELEELKAELERLQQQSAEQQQSGEQGGQQQSGGDQSTQQAMQNLQEAIDALEQAQNSEQSQGENQQATSEEQQLAAREAMQAASERLRESVEQAEEAQQEQLQQQIADAADAVRELNDKQEDTSEQLYDALQRAMEARRQGRFDSGLDEQQQDQLAEAKRQMQRDLESIMRDLEDTASRFEEQSPQAAEQLERALENLDANNISERIGISGDMIDEGQAPQAAMREEEITQALQNLQTDLADASGIASSENQSDQQVASADEAARAVQQLRQALAEALSEASGDSSGEGQQQAQREQLERGQTGEQNSDQDAAGQQGSEGEQGQGEQGQGQEGQGGQGEQGQGQEGQNGQGQGQGQGQEGQNGQGQGQGQGDGQTNTPNSWGQGNGNNDRDIRINDGQAQLIEESIVQLQELTSRDIEDLSEQTRQALSDLSRELGNEDEVDRRIDANVRLLLRQLEQLELSIYKDSKPDTATRSQTRTDDPKGYDRLTEEYFRRLSEPSGS